MVLRGPPAAIDKLVTGEDRGIVGKKRNPSVLWAVLAAALYAINAPASKLLLQDVSPTMMAAMLYLGAGIGMSLLGMGRQRLGLGKAEQKLTRKDLPFTIGMIVLDIAAPICLMIGLTSTTPANASLLNNFEIAATSMIALFLFKEPVSKRLWLAIGLITLSSVILSFEDASSLHFSAGSLFVLLACICWGFENNCTRMMSQSDPLEVVVLKGFGSPYNWRALPSAPIHSLRAAAGLRGLRTEHFLLRLRPAKTGGGENQRLLCDCSVYRRNPVPFGVPAAAQSLLLGCIRYYAFGYIFCRINKRITKHPAITARDWNTFKKSI